MLLVGNGRLITRDEEKPFMEDGCVCIEGQRIAGIGGTSAMRQKYPQAEFVDAKGGIIMPGLINAHNHIYSAFARGLSIKGNNPTNFLEILDGTWWHIDRTLNLADTYHSAMVTYLDCIRNGVTTVFDHHASYGGIEGSLFRIADAARELGVRTCLCYEVSDRDGEAKMQAAVKENADFIQAAMKDDSDMQKAMMGMHASFTLSDASLELCRKNTPEGIGCHIHVAEGMDDVYITLKKYNKRIINRLFDMDLLGPHSIMGHCIHINPAEMDILKETDTMVVHNPESNMGNAVGCPPVLRLMEKGILTGLGTDGYTNDMIESYKVGNILHKHSNCDPTVAWGEIPQMLFGNNAKIGGRYFKTPLGILKAGAAADVIVMEYNPFTPLDGSNCNSHILFGMNGRNVVTTIINGKVLMKDRVMTADEERITVQAREQAADMWRRINA
jgi:putative selenium metabolism protein SsnA